MCDWFEDGFHKKNIIKKLYFLAISSRRARYRSSLSLVSLSLNCFSMPSFFCVSGFSYVYRCGHYFALQALLHHKSYLKTAASLSSAMFVNDDSSPLPHGKLKCPSDAHFRIWAGAVGHLGISRLLFYKYGGFGHTTLFTYCFLLLNSRQAGIFGRNISIRTSESREN